MARTNPFKKKPRNAKQSILLFCEGNAEVELLWHLKSIYHARESNTTIKIANAWGGDPEKIFEKAKRKLEYVNYDVCYVLIDGDKPLPKSTPQKIKLIVIEPCLESMLLHIIENKRHDRETSTACKKKFRDKYVVGRDNTYKQTYPKLLSRQILTKMRKKILRLDEIICIFEEPR